jgi:hypothetical protein
MQNSPFASEIRLVLLFFGMDRNFPNTITEPLAMTTSDHVPCVISIQTAIPKSNVFRFENKWLNMEGFLLLVERSWTQSIHYADAAKRIIAQFKL